MESTPEMYEIAWQVINGVKGLLPPVSLPENVYISRTTGNFYEYTKNHIFVMALDGTKEAKTILAHEYGHHVLEAHLNAKAPWIMRRINELLYQSRLSGDSTAFDAYRFPYSVVQEFIADFIPCILEGRPDSISESLKAMRVRRNRQILPEEVALIEARNFESGARVLEWKPSKEIEHDLYVTSGSSRYHIWQKYKEVRDRKLMVEIALDAVTSVIQAFRPENGNDIPFTSFFFNQALSARIDQLYMMRRTEN